MADKIKPSTPVRATTHPGDTRSNIPTAELESFARPEEKRPAIVRYPRDTTLDPQLVWKGKDEQDADDLKVPAVPIYIQETIDPLALVEELRADDDATLLLDALQRLPARFGADRLTRYHQLYPAVDLPALSRVVGAHRLGLTEAFGGDRICRYPLRYQVVAHGPRALFG